MVCFSFLHCTSLCISCDKNLEEFLMLCFVLWASCYIFLSIKFYVCTWVDLLFVNMVMWSPKPFPKIHLSSHKLYDRFAKVTSIIPRFASGVNHYNCPTTIVARWLWVLLYLVNATKSFVVIWFYYVHFYPTLLLQNVLLLIYFFQMTNTIQKCFKVSST
jgi:hypothetical protein